MRVVPLIISTIITAALIFLLNTKWGSIPPLGKFLSPQQGFWQNAEPVNANWNEELKFPELKGAVSVYLDDRLVPHVFAQKDEDLYFVQGYLHAKFRLWQMEFQTFAASGRVSEFLGDDPRFIRYDREQRRSGMVYAAKNALQAMEEDGKYKPYFDAYTKGVNAYIGSLSSSKLPVEYKLLDYQPELWSNLKIALFLKLMSKDLAGYDRDLEFTNERSVFSLEDMRLLYPEYQDSTTPIVPHGQPFDTAGVLPVEPLTADSVYFKSDTSIAVTEQFKPNPNNGSNNWAVAGTKTRSGYPILANDPHLGLKLPSIWFEMQLSTPQMNSYGASFPGSPNIIIGFNDDIAFGFTNAQRDVKDYFNIKLKDRSKKEYWYEGAWTPTKLEVETIKVRGKANIYDTIAYTAFGPLMYDQSFLSGDSSGSTIAVRWAAHEKSNDGKMWFMLNRAKSYEDYLEAIRDFSCPGQNMLFASRTGDIAVWQQARFPARWKEQGLYVMPGEDSTYNWQGFIPQNENPHVLNPASGFIQSANQRPVDSTYPYFIPGNYITPRGVIIANYLQNAHDLTTDDMMKLQTSYYSINADRLLQRLMPYLEDGMPNPSVRKYVSMLQNWDHQLTPESKAATVYQVFLDKLEQIVWTDEFARIKGPKTFPSEQTLIDAVLRDSTFKFYDDITTPETETLQMIVGRALLEASVELDREEPSTQLVWWRHKKANIAHLLSTVTPFGRYGLVVGGWNNTVNAITDTHGPSWRMIVELTSPTKALGIYPGGQSGNPGSRFYDNFINDWVVGKYYSLWMMKPQETSDKRIIGKLTFNKA